MKSLLNHLILLESALARLKSISMVALTALLLLENQERSGIHCTCLMIFFLSTQYAEIHDSYYANVFML